MKIETTKFGVFIATNGVDTLVATYERGTKTDGAFHPKWLMSLNGKEIAPVFGNKEAAVERAKALLEQPIPAPLNKQKIWWQMKKNKIVHGIIAVELSEFIASDLESILDIMSERLTGSPLLMNTEYTVVAHEKNTLYVRVSGDASSILEELED